MAMTHEGKLSIKCCIGELNIKGIIILAFLLKSDIALIKKRIAAGRLFVNKINSQGIRTAGTKR